MRHPDEKHGVSTIVLFIMTSLALLFFCSLFVVKKIGPLDFWWWFTLDICLMGALVFRIDGDYIVDLLNDIHNKPGEKLFYGLFSAGILYAIFFAGNRIARQIFDFAESGIRDVYEIRTGASLWKVVSLMVIVIGPGEELLWRGYFQKQYSRRYGSVAGFAISLGLYTLIHAGSRNAMLVLSAIVAGSFWGWLYRWRGSLVLNIVSHVTWDLAVFVLFPFHHL